MLNNKSLLSGLTLLLMTPLSAFADPTAIKIPANMRSLPQVQALIREYNQIAASSPICNDKKNFGIQTVQIDGQSQARYYVDVKGVQCIPRRMRPDEAWSIDREWTTQDNLDFRNFIQAIGQAVETGKCSSVDSCLTSAANPLRTKIDAAAFHYADCADYPYYLRAYFAFRRGLPFTYAAVLRDRPPTADDEKAMRLKDKTIAELQAKAKKGPLSQVEQDNLKGLLKNKVIRYDPRYTVNGNFVVLREWVVNENPHYPINFFRWVPGFQDVTSTATMRMWRNEGAIAYNTNHESFPEIDPDTYSPTVDLRGIGPGTMVYKTDGHTGVVYRVDSLTGKIYYMDSHPDNSVSSGVLDETWTREMAGRATYGGGFKNWRPIVYDIIPAQPAGFFKMPVPEQRVVRLKTDGELGLQFSSEQYDRFPSVKTMTTYNEKGLNAQVDYIDFLRLRMSNGRYRIDPAVQFHDDLSALCHSAQIRRESVMEATEKDFHKTPHPPKLPDNIYGADGDWERYSTPGQDVTFKQRIINLNSSLSKYKAMIQSGHPLLKPGATVDTMKQDLLKVWDEVGTSCQITYKNSAGNDVKFNLQEAVVRAPLMSFDPYLCPERRFGASTPEELATCTDTPDKADWYAYTQFLRARTDKATGEAMGWSLDELKKMNRTQIDQVLIDKLDVKKSINAL